MHVRKIENPYRKKKVQNKHKLWLIHQKRDMFKIVQYTEN